MFCYYDSRDKLLCSSFGAVPQWEYTRLRLRLPENCGVWHAFLLLTKDGEQTVWYEMEFEFKNGDCLYYKIDISLPSGLYWYHFCYETESGQRFIKKTDGSKGFGEYGTEWQKSVYRKDFSTPDWITGGVIYQIFPDRFCSSGTKKQETEGRWLRDDWGATPQWKQDESIYTLCNDFFGGDLKGIEQKLDYIESLGVTCIYLNPIFLASSNHRYNTADYEKIDTLLGTEEDFVSLCKSAHERGIKIILDGVFSHTGHDSKYFKSALESQSSPYFSWFKFNNWPYDYHSWWGVKTLPEVNEDDEGFLDYICGENGILRYWLRLGADGWRLDVADELPDLFLDRLRTAIKAEKPDAFILGEVWEDASNKSSYGSRRRYFEGRQLDSVMNYPLASAIIDFAKYGNAEGLQDTVLTLAENYPKTCLDSLMNHVGTHDTARILTMLGIDGAIPETREEQSKVVLNDYQKDLALKRLKITSLLQYTLPGVPSLYYGDEAEMQGFGDPFCRGCYPWGNENRELIEHYKFLGGIRKNSKALKDGDFVPLIAENGFFAFMRKAKGETLLVAANCGNSEYTLQDSYMNGGKILNSDLEFCGNYTLNPNEYLIIKK